MNYIVLSFQTKFQSFQIIRAKQKAFLEEYSKKEKKEEQAQSAPRNLLETEHDPDIMF